MDPTLQEGTYQGAAGAAMSKKKRGYYNNPKRESYPMKVHTIDDIIYPVKTKRGIKYEKKRRPP